MPDLTPSDYSNIPDNKVHGANIWDVYFFGVADTYALHAGTTPENCAGVSH